MKVPVTEEFPSTRSVLSKNASSEAAFFRTYHVNMRLAGRFITREVILDARDTYEMVEAYPDDKYLPSYLVLGRHGQEVFHVLFAVDIDGNNVRVITSYRPDRSEWEPDQKTRRPKS